MGLKAALETLEGVDEGVRDFYTQAEDGNYYLDVDGVDSLPQVQGLAATLRKFKEVEPSAHGLAEKLERLDELESFGALDLSADEVRDRLQKLEELEASGDDAVAERIESLRQTYDKREAALKEKQRKELEKREAENEELSTFVRQLTVDNALDRALDKVEVIPSTKDAVKALLKERGPRVIKEDEGYKGIFETDLGEIGIEDYVEAWAKRDEAAPFMPASGNKGSGAKSGGTGGTGGRANPFNPETRNVTEQMRLAKNNPRLAKQLAGEAGVALPDFDAEAA